MYQTHIQYADSRTELYFDVALQMLEDWAPKETSFIITDENLMIHLGHQLKQWPVIIVPPGESSKSLAVLDDVIRQLIALQAGRDALIIGIGGGVVTDIAGFVAGIYMRGVRCALVPTSILGMVDAAIGGKNGLDIGEYKNMIGLIRQPEWILFDHALLETLPDEEWVNGFAEVIKHASIRDREMFALLEQHHISDFQADPALLQSLIRKNVLLKSQIVQQDERESGDRQLLNFGHTLGHAIENAYQLRHGHAIAIGMMLAAQLSEQHLAFRDIPRLERLLQQYGLPVSLLFNQVNVLQQMQADKKRRGGQINYVLLKEIGTAVVLPLTLPDISAVFQ